MIKDNYPVFGLSCFSEGQAGHCGKDCKTFLSGDCDIPFEMLENINQQTLSDDERFDFIDNYLTERVIFYYFK